jgi:hypothetical protein
MAQLASRFGGQSLKLSRSPIPEQEPTGRPALKLTRGGSPILARASSPPLEPIIRSPILEREPTYSLIPKQDLT